MDPRREPALGSRDKEPAGAVPRAHALVGPAYGADRSGFFLL